MNPFESSPLSTNRPASSSKKRLHRALKTAAILLATQGEATSIAEATPLDAVSATVANAGPPGSIQVGDGIWWTPDPEPAVAPPLVDEAYVREVASRPLAPEQRALLQEPSASLPKIHDLEERTGYTQETFERLLRNGYPRFLVRPANVSSIFVTESHSTHRLGEAVEAPGPAAARVRLMTHIFETDNDTELDQAMCFQLVLAHELAHTASAITNVDSPLEERLAVLRELEEIVSTEALWVRFPYIVSIRDSNHRAQTEARMQEYFAEAIAHALNVSLEEGEDWIEAYRRYLQDHFHASYLQAERTARFAIGYIRRHSPEYDQQQGFQARKNGAMQMAAERGRAVTESRTQHTGPVSEEARAAHLESFVHWMESIDNPVLQPTVTSIFGNHRNWQRLEEAEVAPSFELSGDSVHTERLRNALTSWKALVHTLLTHARYLASNVQNTDRYNESARALIRSVTAFNNATLLLDAQEAQQIEGFALQYLYASVGASAASEDL